jgi:2,5-diketo-D-gluconate reductase A
MFCPLARVAAVTAVVVSRVEAGAAPVAPTVEIAPGVNMPLMNMGICNHTLWLETGGRGIDTAFVYGDDKQQEVGAAVRASGLSRSSLFVTTKVPCCPADRWMKFAGGSPGACPGNDTQAQIKHDLQNLGLGYVDLMLIHWPCDTVEETMAAYRALEDMHAAGKARAIGVSNFNATMVDAVVQAAKVKPAINQCGFSIAGHSQGAWGRDDATVAACQKHGITYEACVFV